PSLNRWWISVSSSRESGLAVRPSRPWSVRGLGSGRAPRRFGTAPDSATVSRSDDGAAQYVQAAKARHEQPVAPADGPEQRNRPERHEGEPHGGHDPNGERASGDHPRAAEEKPGSGQEVEGTAPDERGGDDRAGGERRAKADREPARRAREQRLLCAPRLPPRGGCGDGHRDHGQGEPRGQPALASSQAIRPRAGRDRDRPDERESPAGERGERRRALHRPPDVVQVGERALVERRGSALELGAGTTADRHGGITPQTARCCQVLCDSELRAAARYRGSRTRTRRTASATTQKAALIANTEAKPAASTRRPETRAAAQARGATADRPSPT